MDQTTAQLVNYALSFSEKELTAPVLDAALLHLVDSIACAIAGRSAESAQVASRVAKAVKSEPGATVFGPGNRTSPELAAFANTEAWTSPLVTLPIATL